MIIPLAVLKIVLAIYVVSQYTRNIVDLVNDRYKVIPFGHWLNTSFIIMNIAIAAAFLFRNRYHEVVLMIIRDLIDQLLVASPTMNSTVHVCIKGEWKDVEKAIPKTDGEGGFVEILIEGNE